MPLVFRVVLDMAACMFIPRRSRNILACSRNLRLLQRRHDPLLRHHAISIHMFSPSSSSSTSSSASHPRSFGGASDRHSDKTKKMKSESLSVYAMEKETWAEAYAPAWALPYIQLARLNRPAGTWFIPFIANKSCRDEVFAGTYVGSFSYLSCSLIILNHYFDPLIDCVGTYMLMWPCFWSTALAAPAGCFPDMKLLALFATGSLIMRSAGCTINDMWDKDFDKQVQRTNQRPLAVGSLTVAEATRFLALQLSAGYIVSNVSCQWWFTMTYMSQYRTGHMTVVVGVFQRGVCILDRKQHTHTHHKLKPSR